MELRRQGKSRASAVTLLAALGKRMARQGRRALRNLPRPADEVTGPQPVIESTTTTHRQTRPAKPL